MPVIRIRLSPSTVLPHVLCLAALLVASPGAAQDIITTRPALPPSPLLTRLPTTGTGAISGVVVDATTGQPVAGAVVSLARLDVSASIMPQPRFVTDARGRFVFSNLPPSPSYYLGARRFGYTYTRYGWAAPNGPLTIADIARIPIVEGQWTGDIKIPLWRLGSITGHVIDERNEPVAGVAVRAYSTRHVSGQPQLVGGAIVSTDDRGMYRISDLEPGRYIVAVPSVQSTVPVSTAEAPQVRPVGELASGGIGGGNGSSVSSPGIDVDGRHRIVMTNFPTPPPPGAGVARAYATTFYPGARTAADAQHVEVGYGDARTAIDMQLSLVNVGPVSGRVEAPPGTTPAKLLVRLLPVGGERLGFGAEAATALIEADGTFTFLNVPEGEYTLLAQPSVMDFTSGSASNRFADAPGFPAGGISVGSVEAAPGLSYLTRSGAASSVWGRMPVSVVRGGRNDLVLTLRPTVKLTGRVVFVDGTPPRRLLLHAEPANGDPALGQPSAFTREGDASLAFAFDNLLGGTYLISNTGLVSVMIDGRDVKDTGFDASLGRDFDDVVVTLTERKIEVNGTVRTRPGQAPAAVIAFPADPARWVNYGWSPPRFRTARSGLDGTFKLERLIDGDYLVIAVDASRIDAWTDPRFLAAAAPLATRVSLKWGDTRTVDLPVSEVVVK